MITKLTSLQMMNDFVAIFIDVERNEKVTISTKDQRAVNPVGYVVGLSLLDADRSLLGKKVYFVSPRPLELDKENLPEAYQKLDEGCKVLIVLKSHIAYVLKDENPKVELIA